MKKPKPLIDMTTGQFCKDCKWKKHGTGTARALIKPCKDHIHAVEELCRIGICKKTMKRLSKHALCYTEFTPD